MTEDRRQPIRVHWDMSQLLRLLLLISLSLLFFYRAPIPVAWSSSLGLIAIPLITLWGLKRWQPWYFSQSTRAESRPKD